MPVSDHLGQQSLAVDRASLVEWYLRNRERSRRLFDLIDPDGVLHAADRASQPDRVLRGAPAGIQRDRVPQARARSARASTSGSKRCSPAASIPRPWSRRAAQRRCHAVAGSRKRSWPSAHAADEAVLSRARATHRSSRIARDASRRSHLHGARARGDAPGDAALHVAPPAARHKRKPSRSHLRARWRARRAATSVRIPAGAATLGARPRRAVASAGTTSSASSRVDVPAFDIDVHNVTNADFLEFVEAGGYARRELWTDERLGVAARASSSRIPIFWVQRGRRSGSWRGMFEDIPLPLAWPVYVSQAEARRSRAGRERRLPTEAEYHRAAFGTPEGERARSFRGATRRPTRRAATSISRAGIRSRPARVRRARARGACTISSATAGSGRRPCSGRSPASSRWPRIPSTRPTSSTASTSS